MTRRGCEFSTSVKLSEWRAAGGCCRSCGRKLFASDEKHFDHIRPIWDGGDGSKGNCQVLCAGCHGTKTHRVETPQRAERDRHQKRAAGIRPKRAELPFGRRSAWKRKITGEIVRRER